MRQLDPDETLADREYRMPASDRPQAGEAAATALSREAQREQQIRDYLAAMERAHNGEHAEYRYDLTFLIAVIDRLRAQLAASERARDIALGQLGKRIRNDHALMEERDADRAQLAAQQAENERLRADNARRHQALAMIATFLWLGEGEWEDVASCLQVLDQIGYGKDDKQMRWLDPVPALLSGGAKEESPRLDDVCVCGHERDRHDWTIDRVWNCLVASCTCIAFRRAGEEEAGGA